MSLDRSILSLLIWAPVIGAVVCFIIPRDKTAWIQRFGIIWSLIPLAISLALIVPLAQLGWGQNSGAQFTVNNAWLEIGNFHVRYALYVDGLSLPLVILTTVLTTICLIYSTTIEKRVSEYYGFFLLMEAALVGTFLAADLFLFYIFWEVSLLPMYFLIGIWGGPRREYAAIKFFLFTLVGSVAMLLAFIWIYFQLPDTEKTFIFIRQVLPEDAPVRSLAESVPLAVRGATLAPLAWWGIFLGFCIKVPAFPFHTWLPDAHVEAPTAGSVILAGIMLKMGGYAIFRILLPLMPEQSYQFSQIMMIMAVMGVVYGALVALAQTDFKKLVAYSSVNHMGYFMMGAAATAAVLSPETNQYRAAAQTAAAGALYQQIAHGILTSAMFLIVGVIYERAHTRNLNAYGGIGVQMPAYGGFFRLFAMGSLGLPAMAGFIAEFLVFAGAFSVPSLRYYTIFAGLGIVVTAAFMLWTIQRVLLGDLNPRWRRLPDMDLREWVSLAPLALLALLFGIIPMLLLNTMSKFVADVVRF